MTLSNASEKELLSRVRRLQKAALAETYDRYSDAIYRYAHRHLGDVDRAEECVAETFSRFLNALHRGGGPRRHLRAYLYRTAHNWITDSYRRPEPIVPWMDTETIPSQEIGPSRETLQREEQEAVRAALAHLTPDQRQVIALKFLEGWKNDEVARALGKTTGAVKSLQHRALSALRRELLREEEAI